MQAAGDTSTIYQRPVELLQRLIQFDTTNPPGRELECISFVKGLLTEAGIESAILGQSPERPNLVARLKGAGNAPPLLLYGHVDVVTVENQQWQYPPFEGRIADGFVWGRGAVDMKGGVAMMLAAFLRAKAENARLPGDVVLAVVCDEEVRGNCGSSYLVRKHADLFEGIRYAIGEAGGYTWYVDNQRFYPIMVAEKRICWLKATLRGPGGHGSTPVRGGAMAKLGRLLQQVDERRLPVHVTPAARLMFEAMASALSGPTRRIFSQISDAALTNDMLDELGERGRIFDPVLHNTVSPTLLDGSPKINVIPGEVSVGLDGRILPGYGADDLLAELHDLLGADVEFEIIHGEPGPAEPDMGLFDTLADILREADPDGVPVPILLSATTDGSLFSQLGIQTYGYLPMKLPEDLSFMRLAHGVDERVPVDAVGFGTDAIYALLQRFGE